MRARVDTSPRLAREPHGRGHRHGRVIGYARGVIATIFTIGHSLHPFDHFVALLRAHEIARLVDVRSHPVSKRAPQFGKAALARELALHAIAYDFLGRELGGRPSSAADYRADGSLDYTRRATAPDFVAGIEQLVGWARLAPTAILCAEEDPEHCHRKRLIAPALQSRGDLVRHIRGDGRLEPDGAEVDEGGSSGYFAECTLGITVFFSMPHPARSAPTSPGPRAARGRGGADVATRTRRCCASSDETVPWFGAGQRGRDAARSPPTCSCAILPRWGLIRSCDKEAVERLLREALRRIRPSR